MLAAAIEGQLTICMSLLADLEWPSRSALPGRFSSSGLPKTFTQSAFEALMRSPIPLKILISQGIKVA
jgi:hypothetical protein